MKRDILVEVAYCLPNEQSCVTLRFTEPPTAGEAVKRSKFLDRFELHLEGENPARIGIYGKECALDTLLKPGDRVEIYRPLLISPTEARRLRAKNSSG